MSPGRPFRKLPSSALNLRSVHARIGVISVLLQTLLLGLGVLSLALFNNFNGLSNELREVWLPSTRILGDLNNDTSDYRTAEGDIVLAPGDAERDLHLGILAELGRSIARRQAEFEHLPRSGEDANLYAAFQADWTAYRAIAARVAGLASAGQQPQATSLYRTASRTAYNAASDRLGQLTSRNVDRARLASGRIAAAYRDGHLVIVTMLLAAGALMAAALTYIRRRVSRPLMALAGSMRRLATNSTDIEIDGTARQDEIGEMARAVVVFRANAIDLLQGQRGLAQQAAMLEEKLAYEQALTRAQRNFVATISHEFRTPLGAIDAHAQRLINMREQVSPADIGERAGRVRASVRRITTLMEELLGASRLMDGEARLFFKPARLDLRTLLQDVCIFHREVSPQAQIIEDYAACDLHVEADAKLLFQAFSNILSNAIKYSGDQAVVHVTAGRGGDRAVVGIADRGIGISEADRDNLFTRYYRGGNVAGIVGSGIGLYLVKLVVDLHGGGIDVEAREGGGSRFLVFL